MITGIHAILFSRHSDEVRGFLRDVLALPSVDAGDGWPIFTGPPMEIAVHPTDEEPEHELYLMCDDVRVEAEKLAARGIQTTPIEDRGWGLSTTIRLPGGEEIGLYEPRHPSPIANGIALPSKE